MLRRFRHCFDSRPSRDQLCIAVAATSFLAAILAASRAVDAQTRATNPPKSAAVLRVTTRLVEVSVLVHDKKGNPVSGLTKDDFELLDNGKPQQISLFSEKSSRPLTGKPLPLPPGTFSNRPAMEGNVTTAATVILFDALNTDFSSQADVRNRMIEFMKAQLKSNDKIAIYLLGRDLRVVRDFTGEPSSLLAALTQNKPFPVPEYTPPSLSAAMPSSGGAAAGGSGLNGPVISQMQQAQQAIAFMSGEVGAFYARLHIDLTTNALVAIANHLRHVPGRKNLIWLSAGFPMEIADPRSPVNTSFSGKAQKAARALSDADVAIYPVNARGLIAPDLALDGISSSGRPGGALQAAGIETIPTMRFLASLTGGVAYSNSNDIASAVRHAIDDSVVSYALGFYPQDTKWDGAFHDLNVRIAKPGTGLSVRFRRGYYATPDAPFDRKMRDSQIVDAISSPLDASGVGITASMEEPKISNSKIRIIHLKIDANAIHLEEKKGRWDGAFDIIFVQRTAAGKVLDPSDQTMKMHLLPATYQQVLSNGYRFTRQINLAPDAAEIRTIVRDTTSGEIGSLTIPLASELAASR